MRCACCGRINPDYYVTLHRRIRLGRRDEDVCCECNADYTTALLSPGIETMFSKIDACRAEREKAAEKKDDREWEAVFRWHSNYTEEKIRQAMAKIHYVSPNIIRRVPPPPEKPKMPELPLHLQEYNAFKKRHLQDSDKCFWHHGDSLIAVKKRRLEKVCGLVDALLTWAKELTDGQD